MFNSCVDRENGNIHANINLEVEILALHYPLLMFIICNFLPKGSLLKSYTNTKIDQITLSLIIQVQNLVGYITKDWEQRQENLFESKLKERLVLNYRMLSFPNFLKFPLNQKCRLFGAENGCSQLKLKSGNDNIFQIARVCV